MRGRRGERGAVIVEAAFALPILMALVLGLIDFSQWEFQRTQAASAARDGARMGIIHYQDADVSSCATAGSDCQLIRTAVAQRLPGQSFTMDTPVCIHPNDGAALTGGCNAAISGCDRIKIVVHWTRDPLTFVLHDFGTQTITGEAEMVIAGRPNATPTATVDSQGCI